MAGKKNAGKKSGITSLSKKEADELAKLAKADAKKKGIKDPDAYARTLIRKN